MKLLVDSYTSQELNKKAWALYSDFRPDVNEWGKRSEIRCSRILDLRKNIPTIIHDSDPRVLEFPTSENEDEEPDSKKVKLL